MKDLRWKNKQSRRKVRLRTCKSAQEEFGLFTEDDMLDMGRTLEKDGFTRGVLQSADRVRSLLDGMSGIALHRIGQVQAEAYMTAIRTIEAQRFTTPRQLIVEEWNRRARRAGIGGMVS